MHEALVRIYDDHIASDEMIEAAALVRTATSLCDPIGRLLFAGWASLDWPVEPHLALWHGCTLLREYRSGNHLIAIAAEGLSGCESIVSHVAVGGAPRVWIADEAGWTANDEAVAIASLRARGWIDSAGVITDEGRAGRARIEAMTDELEAPMWARFGKSDGQRLFDLLSELTAELPPDDQLDWRHHYPA